MRQPQAMPETVMVIGAGICGVSTAIWLRRAGHRVTLIDRAAPGAGASYGNAGLMAQWALVPVSTPGLIRTGLKYLADPGSPLFLQWRRLPEMLPWLAQFSRRANDRDTRHTAQALLPLVGDSVDQHRALATGTGAEKWLQNSDVSFAYPTRAAFDADRYSWALREEIGLRPEIVEGPKVQEAEPILGDTIRCLAVLRGHGHIADPGAYVTALARGFEGMGGHIVRADVKDFEIENGQIAAVDTDAGRFACDRAVLAAGIHSRPLMRKLGLKVPLMAERGYHLMFRNPSQMPRNPMMMTTGKFAVTPMQGGLRCAGTVEFAHPDSPPSPKPLRLLRRHAARAFPGLRHDAVEEWVGSRPSTPDSLPLIGEIGTTGIFAAFGHQHVGLTAGPKTGRWVAGLISGQPPNTDLSPYDPGRYG